MNDKAKNALSKNEVKTIVLIPLFSSFISVCSFITVPSAIPFTLQTFGVFATLALLGGKLGTLSIVLYIFTGIIGLPVFSGFSGGIGHLFGPSGGYIIGFVLTSLFYWLITHLCGDKIFIKALALIGGALLCYLFGSLWYTFIYFKDLSLSGFLSSISICILPFIIPDSVKLALSLIIERRLRKLIK